MFRWSSGATIQQKTRADARGDGRSATRVRRVTVLAPHHFQPQEVPAERASPCLYVSHSLLPSPHFPSLFLPLVLHFTLPVPLLLLLHPLPEALSSELPRFFIKEISLEPSNYYGKRKKTEKRRHWGKCPLFILSPCHFLSHTNVYIYFAFLPF